MVDLDLSKFFDNLDHELMMRAVRTHTEESWVLLNIEQWLKAPIVRQDGTRQVPAKGTPQGGVASPLLANLFLHYAFDFLGYTFRPRRSKNPVGKVLHQLQY